MGATMGSGLGGFTRTVVAALLASAMVTGPTGAAAVMGADLSAVIDGGHELHIDGESPADWMALADRLGPTTGAALVGWGFDRSLIERLPAVPTALQQMLADLPALAAVDRSTDDEGDGDLGEERAGSSPVVASPTVDVDGDGADEVWVTRSGYERRGQAQLVDGASGEVLWARPDLWSAATPRLVGDVTGDGVADLIVLTGEVLDIVDVDEEEGGLTRVGVEVVLETGVEVVSGATGVRLWAQHDEETFGLAFRFTESPTEWWFGLEIRLENTLLDPHALPEAGANGEVVMQRVDQHVISEVGGRGAYVWGTEAPVSGVTVTDRARLLFEGASRASLVDAGDGGLQRVRELVTGEQVGFFDVVANGSDPESMLLWSVYTVPDQHIECVEILCVDALEPNMSVALTAEDLQGTVQWESSYHDRYDISVRATEDLLGDGRGELLVVDVVPDGDGHATEVAVVDAASGVERWRSSLGETDASVLDVHAWNGAASVVLLYEIVRSFDRPKYGVRIHRLEGVGGATLPSSEHLVDFPDPPSAPLSDDAYVRGMSSYIWLASGGDSDGDGTGDVLISLAQTRTWSDDRPQTYWGTWVVESSASGEAVHMLRHEDPARVVTGWHDTSGDLRGEFVEHVTATGDRILRSGADAAPVWQLPHDAIGEPVGDVNGDAVADILTTATAKDGTGNVSILDGPTQALLWTLNVAS